MTLHKITLALATLGASFVVTQSSYANPDVTAPRATLQAFKNEQELSNLFKRWTEEHRRRMALENQRRLESRMMAGNAQGTLGTARASLPAVPLASVRTDRPAPYVQSVENGKVAYRAVELGARGSADGIDVVAVTGLANSTVVILGNVGILREGLNVKFTAINASLVAPNLAASSAKTAP